jgi:argininosuccinate lyase
VTRLWDKGGRLDERILAFTAGEDYVLDQRLVRYDVQGSIAHAEMLVRQGLLDAEDGSRISAALMTLGAEHAAGRWAIELADEDAHTALERRLTERVGPAGGRIHLGRSRNDQVLTALRLYLKDAAQSLAAAAGETAGALDRLVASQGDVPLPGYTHMQPAMPSSVGLWAGGFAAELRDDAEGLQSAARRADRNPLGSAAGYGAPGLTLDREATRERLGFATLHEPVTAVQLSRGKAEATLVFEIALLLQDLSRLAADLLLFYMRELAFVSLPDEMTTGSSIMPQKRNPDVFELVRGTAVVAQAALVEILGITSKLPSGYHRDLQRLKAPLFRSIDLGLDTAAIMTHALGGVRFEPANIHLSPELFAAERANTLAVEQGIPFREAYRQVAAALAKTPAKQGS